MCNNQRNLTIQQALNTPAKRISTRGTALELTRKQRLYGKAESQTDNCCSIWKREYTQGNYLHRYTNWLNSGNHWSKHKSKKRNQKSCLILELSKKLCHFMSSPVPISNVATTPPTPPHTFTPTAEDPLVLTTLMYYPCGWFDLLPCHYPMKTRAQPGIWWLPEMFQHLRERAPRESTNALMHYAHSVNLEWLHKCFAICAPDTLKQLQDTGRF